MKNEKFEETPKSFESGIERRTGAFANSNLNSSIKTIYSVITNLVGTAVLVFPMVFLEAG